jgi:DNA-binding NtrC family response regulator
VKFVPVMIVENSSDLRSTLQSAFERRGYLTWTCRTPELAMSLFDTIHPSIVILDLDFEGGHILDLLDIWLDRSPQTRFIVESTNSDAECAEEVMKHGAHAFLVKPFSLAPLFHLLENDSPSGPPVRKAA